MIWRVAGFLDARRVRRLEEPVRPVRYRGGGSEWRRPIPDQAPLRRCVARGGPRPVDALSRDERARRRVRDPVEPLGDYAIADPARAAAINEDPGDPRGLVRGHGVRTVGRGVGAAREATADDLRAPTGACYIWLPTTRRAVP